MADWTCPPGWSPRTRAQPDPWSFAYCAAPGVPECAGAQVALPGEQVCRRLGSACDAGRDSAGPVVRVAAGAPPGGDGSAAAPFGSISAALAAPRAGGATVLLAPGAYAEAVRIERPVTLAGACASGVTLAPPAGDDPVIEVATAGAVAIEDLTIDADRPGVILREAADDVALRRVVLAKARRFGVASDQDRGTLAISDSVLRDVATDDPASSGTAIRPVGAARVVVERTVVERCGGSCVVLVTRDGASPGALELRDSVVRRAEAPPEHSANLVRLLYGASATVERAILERSNGPFVLAGQTGGTSPPLVRVEDLALRDGGGEGPLPAPGILLFNGGRLTARRVLAERLRDAAVAIGESGGLAGRATADLEDVVVRDSQVVALTVGGLVVEGFSDLRARRLLFEDVGPIGVYVSQTGPDPAAATLEDALFLGGRGFPQEVESGIPGIGVIRTTVGAHMAVRAGRT